jgi:cephalosporin hydroxylase
MRERINRLPEIGETVFYQNTAGDMEAHIRVEPPQATSDRIIWIEDSDHKVDSIIALFPDGQYNSRLFF